MAGYKKLDAMIETVQEERSGKVKDTFDEHLLCGLLLCYEVIR